MAYHEILPPLVGEIQLSRANSLEVPIDLLTYLNDLQDNVVVSHGDTNPIRINGVAAETMNLPIATTANAAPYNGISYVWQPVVFPTAGTIRKSFTTSNRPGMITSIAEATFNCVVSQAGVLPLLGVRIEYQIGANWQLVQGYEPGMQGTTAFMSPGVGNTISLGYLNIFTDVMPNTNYRVTLMAGHYSSAALNNTGQWKIDATGTNTLEFNAWSAA